MKFTIKFLSCAFLMLNSLVVYSIFKYNTAFDMEMLENIFHTDAKEFLDITNWQMSLSFVLFGLLPSIKIYNLQIIYRSFFAEIIRKICIICVCLVFSVAIVALQYQKFSTFVRVNNHIFHYLVPTNYLASTIEIIKKHRRSKNTKALPAPGKAKITNKDDINIFLVIGETARKANFSLYGYAKNTNPLLKKQDLVVMKNPISCGTATLKSVPCMLAHLSREEFIKNDEKYEFLPEFVSKLGVNVKYIDNNFGKCYKTCNNVETIFTQNEKSNIIHNTETFDEYMLDKIGKLPKGKNLIILHQNGSHGPRYNKRYPKSFEKFKPVCDNSDITKCTRESLINAYDNTILYTDFVLNELIKFADKQHKSSVVIYISDHGESLGENGYYLHGFPYKIAPKEQKEVPFIIYFSKNYKKRYKNYKPCINNKQSSSHDNIFHSIIGLLGIKADVYNKNLDIFHDCR